MTATARALTAIHGPQGNGTAYLGGTGEFTFFDTYALNAAQSVAVNGTAEQIALVVPGLSPYTSAGAQQDSLPTVAIGTVTAVRLAAAGVALAANLANATFAFFLRRAGAVVGGGAFAGWAAASNAAIAAYSQVVVPFLPTNTALVPAPGTGALVAANALLPIQAGDIITLSVATSAAVTVPFLASFVDAM